jgi:outer membrane biosynthesis protein TonB
MILSVLLHGGLVAAFLVLHAPPPPQGPPIYAVKLIAAAPAASPAEVSSGVVAPKPAPVAKPAAAPPPTPQPKQPKIVAKKAKPTPATPPIPSQTAPPKSSAAAKSKTPPASLSESGGKGSDVQNVNTGGIEFPYPYYVNNIVNEILKRFGQSRIAMIAEVSFVIRRDGSVDPASIQFVKRSGVYSFDLQAMGAIEATAKANVFGPLPNGYHDDILPITFRFSPSLVK